MSSKAETSDYILLHSNMRQTGGSHRRVGTSINLSAAGLACVLASTFGAVAEFIRAETCSWRSLPELRRCKHAKLDR